MPRKPDPARLALVGSASLVPTWRRLPAWTINGLSVTLGLAITQYLVGTVGGGVAAQTALGAAVCTSLADLVMTTERVAHRTLVSLICCAISAALFLALKPLGDLLLPAVAFIVFGAMMTLAWGPKASSVSFGAVLSLVFAMSLPASQGLSWGYVLWGLAGSAIYWVWAVATAWLLQPTWRRLSLVSTLEATARLLDGIGQRVRDPADPGLRLRIVQQEALLADRLQSARDLVFGQAPSARADKEVSLLLHLLELRELAMVTSFELDAKPAERDGPFELKFSLVACQLARSLESMAGQLRRGTISSAEAASMPPIDGLRGELLSLEEAGRTDGREDAVRILRSQYGLIAAIVEESKPTTTVALSCRREDLRKYVAPDEWRLSSVRSEFSLASPVFRHASRTALTVALAYAASHLLPVTPPHPQWIVLTIAAVMQGSLAQTLARRNARLLGTLAGCVLVAVLTSISPASFLLTYFLMASGIAHAFFGVRYSVTAGAAAVMATTQAYLVAPEGGFGVLERFVDTVVGAALGWGATYLLPTWERARLALALKQARVAVRAYIDEAMKVGDASVGPRFTRQKAYDALRALSDARTRSLAEPSSVRLPVDALARWLSAAYALMSHLSLVRLTLVLQAQGGSDPALAQAMAEMARLLDNALCESPSGDAPERSTEQVRPPAALNGAPGLVERLQRALSNARVVGRESATLEAALRRAAQ